MSLIRDEFERWRKGNRNVNSPIPNLYEGFAAGFLAGKRHAEAWAESGPGEERHNSNPDCTCNACLGQ